ncbi:MAG: hypothetical protein LBJ17_02165, partial [Dysgonamonadaceae bacterium]|nr:hypothetical protein [Dysgonamonadaceae bacterium]
MKKHIFLLILLFSVFSCQDNRKEKNAKKIIKEWTGKTILFPSDAQCCVAGNDTLPSVCDGLFQKDFKILLYVDSVGCSSCRLKLSDWKQLIEESDTLFQDKLGFLFFFQPKNRKEMSYIFRMNEFDFPVFIDMNNSLDKKNHFPAAMEHQCFLLNRENEVIAIGNPAANIKIWKLYKKI